MALLTIFMRYSVRRVVSDFSASRPGTIPKCLAASRRHYAIVSQQVSRDVDYEVFDPTTYLKYHYGVVDSFHRHSLKYLHEFCKCYEAPSTRSGLKILDFGAGPVIANVISASLYASEIVLSNYLESNRKVLQMWFLNRTEKCFRCGWIVIPRYQTGVPSFNLLSKSWKGGA